MKARAEKRTAKKSSAKRAVKVATVAAPVETVLVMRTCNAKMQGHGGFQWPKSGPVAAPDFSPEKICGYGLHGLLWGEGDGSLLDWGDDAHWLVVEVAADEIVNLGGKVKFPRGVVVFCGKPDDAAALIAKRAPKGSAIVSGTATAGDRGTATAGYSGTATAGDSGTATAGDLGTATAGDSGIVVVRWVDRSKYPDRYRLTVGYVGEDGVKPNTKYGCDETGKLVEVAS